MDRGKINPPRDRGARPAGQHRRWLTLAGCLACLFCSCGYHFTSGAGRLPDGTRELVIPQAINLTSEAGVGAFVTKSLRDEAVRAGLDIRGSQSAPRLIARLLIVKSVSRGVAMYGGSFRTREQEVQARLELKLDGCGAKFEQVLDGRESYLSAPDIRGTIANRELALQRLLQRLASQGIDRLARRF